MAAFMLLMTLFLVVVNLVFTVRIWKGRVSMVEVKEKPRITVPRGPNMEKVKKTEQVDLDEIVKSTLEALQVNAEESGEEETYLTEEELKASMSEVMKKMSL